MKLGYLLEEVVPEHGAWDVLGGVAFPGPASLSVTVVLSIVTGAVAYREYRDGRFEPAQFPRFAAAFALTFLLGSGVQPAQYVVWLLHLVPLGAGDLWGLGVSAVFLAVCWMTTQIYPYHYLEVGQDRSHGIDILLGRNLLLSILWVVMICLPSESEPARETMQKTAAGQGGTS